MSVISGGSSGGSKRSHEEQAPVWMRWDSERTTRANQDHQRELETTAIRDLIKHMERNQVREGKILVRIDLQFNLSQ